MSRRLRPAWVSAVLAGLLVVLLLALWLGGEHGEQQAPVPSPAKQEAVKKAPAVVFEEPATKAVEAPPPAEKQTPLAGQHGIALILDDVGYDIRELRRALALHIPIDISVLPDAPHAVEAAQLAHAAGEPVMLHMPMEPANPHYSKLMDDSFLRVGMTREQVRSMMEKALMHVPYVVGVNNHMGSRLTTLEKPMRWVMQVCHEQKLFFIDSRTDKDSVAARMAQQAGLRWGERRVFLDDSVQPEDLQHSWEKARKLLAKDGFVIVIAHPHPQTMSFLEQNLTAADRADIVPLSRLLYPAAKRTQISSGG